MIWNDDYDYDDFVNDSENLECTLVDSVRLLWTGREFRAWVATSMLMNSKIARWIILIWFWWYWWNDFDAKKMMIVLIFLDDFFWAFGTNFFLHDLMIKMEWNDNFDDDKNDNTEMMILMRIKWKWRPWHKKEENDTHGKERRMKMN